LIAVVSLIPVLLFLLLLFLLDSFKLVRIKTLATAFVTGSFIALLAYFINSFLLTNRGVEFGFYSRYIAPFLEELLKASIILILIMRKRTGFLIDAAIYGFATGAGFAVVENTYYLLATHDSSIISGAIRGLGTAIMHSGATSLVAVLAIGALNLERKLYKGFIPGLLLAIFLHSAFNHFYIHPALQTLLVTVSVPALLLLIFKFNERKLSEWLETGFFSEAGLLTQIRKGEFTLSKSGKYLASLKEQFSAEIIVDMYCFITLYLELSVKSKRNMLLVECELPVSREPGWDEKVSELKHLRKTIGKSGELALSPLIKVKQRDLWSFDAKY
jgi:protease PrsW